MHESHEIEFGMNGGQSSDSVPDLWMEMETIETDFAAYFECIGETIGAMRMALDDVIDSSMPDTEIVLVDVIARHDDD